MNSYFTADDVLRALSRVYDPELDRPITELGFVRSVKVGDTVEVEITTSTFWCSPNFIYMMLVDARREVAEELRIQVDKVRVYIRDHLDEERINRCVSEGLSFRECFGEEATGDLELLRRVFKEKSLRSRLYQLALVMKRKGLTYEDIVSLRVESVVDRGDLVELRLGQRVITFSGEEASVVRSYLDFIARNFGRVEYLAIWDLNGSRPTVWQLRELVEGAGRVIKLNFDVNAVLCRLLLESRLSRLSTQSTQ